MGTVAFDDFIQHKICPVFGEITSTNLGLSEPDYQFITSQANIIIYHCAGIMEESLQASVKVTRRKNIHAI